MANAYIQALEESLEKKLLILEQIHHKDEEQYSILKETPVRMEDLDRNFEEKSVLVNKLLRLDEGFETVYENVKDELQTNKSLYAAEIGRMQALITKITELSTTIQAEEARNKASMETMFKREKDKIKQQRSGMKAVASYTQSMRGFPIK